ncbi:hypothetical protein HQ520_07950 [bacterium]|nr:hypothetical protein [bacterium]
MKRIQKRKHGRTSDSLHASSATHVIKIGFDMRKPGDARPVPGKLRGFLLCRDSLGQDNNLQIDLDAMQTLGVGEQQIAQAKAGQLKAAPGLLPTELNFVLVHDAIRAPGGTWEYPGTFGESYECWNKAGLFCFGDGVVAQRRQDDRTRAKIDCVPVGREDTEAKEFCKQSVGKECKAHSRLILCLFSADADNRPQPLSKALGWQARYRFDTSSEYNPMRILADLDAAADRCNGKLHGLTGTLNCNLQKKRYEGGVAPVMQIMFQISEADIREREASLRQMYLEDRRVLALPAPEEAPETSPFEEAVSEHTGFTVEPEQVESPEDEIAAAEFSTDEPFSEEAETEPEAEQDPADPLDGYSDETLADSLSAFAADHLGDYAGYEYVGQKTGKTIRKPIENIDWFFDGQPGVKDRARRDLLRQICRDLLANPKVKFPLIPEMDLEAEGVAAN